MLNCPFCGFDYDEVGLRDGRCRQCGGVLSWDDGDSDVPAEAAAAIAAAVVGARTSTHAAAPLTTPAAALSIAPTPAAARETGPTAGQPTRSAPLSGGAFVSSSPEAVSPNPASPPTDAPSAASPSPGKAAGGDELSTDGLRQVTAMWQPSIDVASRPGMTLKVKETVATSDLQLVVQPRSVRRNEDVEAPAADYELLETIGTGGMGVVYSARQSSIDRTVAVKMLRSDGPFDSRVRDKFLSEAVVTGDLDHPNIVPIYDLGADSSGALFYSMKRVQGTPWSERLSQKSLAENIAILMKVADAVAFAHSRGVVHRDLKPENVMLGDFGEVLLMDWGIALPTAQYRKSGEVLKSQGLGGTPAYMAPEMATGPLERTGPASDVYLLGAILFEIVAGSPPHTGRSVLECVMAAARNVIRPVAIDNELIEIARHAMATRPEDRPPSVQAFQDAIRLYQSHSESITLASRAEDDLNRARQSNQYDDFSRAVYAYQESLAMWSGNVRAGQGLVEAKRAYAECAMAKSDYDLGISLLDEDDPNNRELLARLAAAQTERDARQARLKNIRRLVVFLIATLFVIGAGALYIISNAWQEAVDQRINALRAETVAKQDRAKALDAQELAQSEEMKAKAEKERAEREKQRAEVASQLARQEKLNAELERERAISARRAVEQESYLSEIGLAAENVASNDFDDARVVLAAHARSIKAKLRHWEWGRLNYLCGGGRAAPLAVTTAESEAAIEALALSPDEKTLAIGGAGGKVELWDATSGRRLARLDLGRTVESVAFSADRQRLAAGGTNAEGGCVRIWRLTDGQPPAAPPQDLPRQGAKVHAVAFSPDGRWLVSAADDKTAAIFDCQESQAVRTLRGHLDAVWSAEFSPDGRRIVTAGQDATVRIWSTESGEELQRLRGHQGAVFVARFSPDGRKIASGGYDKQVLVWDLSTAERSTTSLVDEVEKRVEGKEVAAQPHDTLVGHQASIRSLAFSRNGELLISAGQDNAVKIWSANKPPEPSELLKTLTAARDQENADPRLLKTLRGHGGWVQSCLLTQDGSQAFSGGYDRKWKRWDVARYEEQRVFKGYDRPVLAAALTPDGRRLAAALDDGTVRLWDVDTGRELGTLAEGHEFLTSTALFAPDNATLLTAAGDNTLRIWDVPRGVQRQAIAHTGRLGIAALSVDGRRVLTGGDDKTAKLWDVATGELRLSLDRHASRAAELQRENPRFELAAFQRQLPEVTAVAISPDQRLLFTGDAFGKCWIWNGETGVLERELAGHEWAVNGAAFLPDEGLSREIGPHLLTSSADNTVAQWNLKTGVERRGYRLSHPAAVSLMELSADGRRALTVSQAPGRVGEQRVARIWLWDVAAAKVLRHQDRVEETVNSVAFASPDGSRAVITTTSAENSRRTIWQWDLSEAAPADEAFAPHPHAALNRGAVWAVVPSRDGARLATVGGQGARVWNAATGRQEASFQPHAAVNHLGISPDGRHLVTAGSEGAAKIWDLETLKPVRKLAFGHRKAIRSAVYSPDGRQIATAGDDHQVVLWDAKTGKMLGDAPFCRQEAPLRQAVFSPDGRRLVTASDDGTARVWDLTTGRETLRLDGHTAPVLAVCCSADGRWVLTGSEDKTARIWSARTGRPLAILTGHSAPVGAVDFSSDDLRALTGGQDSIAKLWNTRGLATVEDEMAPAELLRPSEVLTLARHDREVTTARFSPDGRHVLTSGRDGSVVIWLGDSIEPAVELTDRLLRYEIGAPPTPIDAAAIVSAPTPDGWNRMTLDVWLSASEGGDRLSLVERPAPDEQAGRTEHVELRDEQIWHHDGTERAAPTSIGRFRSADADRRLTFEFGERATTRAVTTLLRSVTFEARPAEQPRSATREVHCRLRPTAAADGASHQSEEGDETRVIELVVPSPQP